MSYYGLDLGYNRLTVPAAPQALEDFLALKDPDWDQTQAVSTEMVPGEEGLLTSNDGAASLVFPQNSAPSGTVVTYIPLYAPSQEPPALTLVGLNFALEVTTPPEKITFEFAQLVTVTLSYDPADLQGRYDASGMKFEVREDSLTLYYWDTDHWIDAVQTCLSPGNYTRDLAANTLALSVCKAGEYTLVGEPLYKTFLPAINR